MIKITIELWPHGNEKKKKIIGIGTIVNDGTGNHEVGNYKFHLEDKNNGTLAGSLCGHLREDGVWTLIKKCLDRFL